MDLSASYVLSRYPVSLRGRLESLGNHGGFSGARLWRVDAPAGVYCLKAWPADGRSAADLTWIHHLVAKASVLPFVPRVLAASDGATVVAHADRLWELASWLPGRAGFATAPSPRRLESACTALARLHQVWASTDVQIAVCPAVLRRADSWRNWRQLVQSGWRPSWAPLGPYAQSCQELWQLIEQRGDDLPGLLAPWLARAVALQPCVCDPWHDHVLYSGDDVTGLIDFGSVKIDHVAVDVARLLGSLIGNDAVLWDVGVHAYARIRPLSVEERALARDLDRTGTIIAAAHWLRWLGHDRRAFERPADVLARLTHLIHRLRESGCPGS